MCGIIGYTGRRRAVPILLDGLERLEYRGYDSAGVAVVSGEGIRGAYALGILCKDTPDQIIAARKDAPLLIASDVTALLAHTRTVSYMDDGEVAVLTPDSVQVYDRDRRPAEKERHTAEWDVSAAEKGG